MLLHTCSFSTLSEGGILSMIKVHYKFRNFREGLILAKLRICEVS